MNGGMFSCADPDPTVLVVPLIECVWLPFELRLIEWECEPPELVVPVADVAAPVPPPANRSDLLPAL